MLVRFLSSLNLLLKFLPRFSFSRINVELFKGVGDGVRMFDDRI